MTTIGRRMTRAECEREALHCARLAALAELDAQAADKRGDGPAADTLRRGARHWRERGTVYHDAAEDGRA